MNNRFSRASLRAVMSIALSLGFLSALAPSAFAAAPSDHWVGTWGAAPQYAPNTLMLGSADLTLRQIVHVSIGGSRVRIVLSNEFGRDPLVIGGAHIALSAGGPEIKPGSDSVLTFNGRTSVTIPTRATVVSDAIDLKMPPLSDLAVSIFVPVQTILDDTIHTNSGQINYMAPGNVIGEKTLSNPKQFTTWQFLKGVETAADGNAAAIVTLGDSITDGARSRANVSMRWPDELSRRLQADPRLSNLGVVNEGISGNRVLHNGNGPSALTRFDRDVLSQAGVKYLIILESINDIGTATGPNNPHDPVTVDELTAGLLQLLERAHTRGIKVFVGTLTPYGGSVYHSPAGEAMRIALNEWIRSNKSFDGVIDFETAVRDPSDPTRYVPSMDSGDHLHPGDAGYKAMGDAIDLKLFSAR